MVTVLALLDGLLAVAVWGVDAGDGPVASQAAPNPPLDDGWPLESQTRRRSPDYSGRQSVPYGRRVVTAAEPPARKCGQPF